MGAMQLHGSIEAGSLRPIVARLDEIGLAEYSRGRGPAPELGHSTDDAGRAIALASRLPHDLESATIARACIDQLERSIGDDGRFAVRLDQYGLPTDDSPSDDADARAVQGLAAATTSGLETDLRRDSAALLVEAARFRSAHRRAASHLVIAGAHLVRGGVLEGLGQMLLEANAPTVSGTDEDVDWPWPEPRLTYGNGLVVEARLEVADLFGDAADIHRELELLDWLVAHETVPAGHFSFTPVGGRGPRDGHGFDQRPIEAWTLASACARAAVLTCDAGWTAVCRRLRSWFDGENDCGALMWDIETGASYDALTATGVNAGQRTESTLALIATRRALEIAACAPRPLAGVTGAGDD